MNIDASVFIANSSSFEGGVAYEGGAIYANAGSGVWVESCVFRSNSASIGSGGALSVGKETFANLISCEFDSNYASSRGAAISAYSMSQLSVTASTFYNNSASFGGSVTCGLRSICEIRDSNFTGSRSFLGGGTLSCSEASQLQVFHSNFTRSEDEFGGTIFLSFCKAAVQNSVFLHSSSRNRGGILHILPRQTLHLMNV